MMRNCSLELRLPSSPLPQSSQDLQRQQLTIFYNGVMCVCDVTELQARAILCVANKEIEEKEVKTETWSPSGLTYSVGISPVAAAAAGLSMRKSLQRFLQKRKHRSRAAHRSLQATTHPSE